MPMINPDLSEAQALTPIEPGTYKAKIVACEFKSSKAGNPMIVPKFEIDVNGKQRSRNAYLVITGEGAYSFEQLLRACKFEEIADAYKNPDVPNPPFDTDSLIGQELNLVIDADIRKDTNEPSDKIKAYLKA